MLYFLDVGVALPEGGARAPAQVRRRHRVVVRLPNYNAMQYNIT